MKNIPYEHLELTKRRLAQVYRWWNRFTTDEDIPSLGTISRYGMSIGGKGQMFKQTEEIALNLASMTEEARKMAKWVRIVRDELASLQKNEGKSPNRIAQDRAVCNVLYFRAALGYTVKRIAECAFGPAGISRQRANNYFGIAVWNVANRAAKAGMFEQDT